ncbi:hypothetical protein Pan44_12060 [Caulifigura coniformis]|uniref:Uncharacterized protein n=1 Tax=Caulifigura coniformis TaxID=2527983 RepID=A0A517SAN6_9PLAN|nr:hypothetical protein [Caulifigura coniformis]QDT53190.1 hypothetical protein Pan44_12060 [Caulifigura coniformis]
MGRPEADLSMTAVTSKPATRPVSGVWGLIALAGVVVATLVAAESPAALTRTTIHLALVEYAAALWMMTSLSADDWRATTSPGIAVRWLWTWACVTFLVHVACAFHLVHRWSHAHAFEATRQEGGFGEGLYVNYLFMMLWIGDVLWWWISPDNYAVRSRWIGRTLHAFMLFIAFNATIVFEVGLVRLAGAAALMALAARWLVIAKRAQPDQ